MSYRDYFDIDPDYFPQVDKKIIDTVPDLWKKFYPHPSFVNLLKALSMGRWCIWHRKITCRSYFEEIIRGF